VPESKEAPGAVCRSRVSAPRMKTELVSTPTHGKDNIHTPRRPWVATACSMAISALVTFFEDPRVCLEEAVVAESVIMMGRGKNEEALEEETKARRDASLSTCALVVHDDRELGSKSFAFFRLRPKGCHPWALGVHHCIVQVESSAQGP
jgi:hypothetical protein